MTPEEAARYVLQVLRADPTGVTRREADALDVLLAATDPARLPRLLAPGEEIPPGCTASLRAAIVSGPAGATPCLTWQEPDHGGRCRACGHAREAHAGRVASRSFLPQGCTSEQIATAAGVAARELVAEHGAPAGVLVEVRLVRRGGQREQAPSAALLEAARRCPTWQDPGNGTAGCRLCGAGYVMHLERTSALQSVGQDGRNCACLNPLRGALPTSGACFNCGGHVSAKRVAQMGEP